MELHIKKSKGFGKLRAKGGEKDFTRSKHKEVHVKMNGADPKMVAAMRDMICAATK
jgi:hypothetical protein